MTQQIWIERNGGPEVMQWREVDLPAPGPGEVRMRINAAGVNYIDTYHRTGLYPIELPSGLGLEAAGVIEAVGPGVEGFATGDRVATFGPTLGAYATEMNLPAKTLFRIPDGISDEDAAALLLKGCTAEMLVERCGKVEPGMTVLVHAAAGGMGLILCQWLNAIGATVIGTVSSEAKGQAAQEAGAHHIVNYKAEDTVARVKEITGGKGVPVVLDGVGGSTWEVSLDCTARRGLIASYGNAGGPVENVALATLGQKGAVFVTRPGVFHYYVDPAEREAGSRRLFEMIGSGKVTAMIGQRFALSEAADVHRKLEAGETTGATILLP